MSANATKHTRASGDVMDRIVLTLPASPRLRGVATLVLGGIGTRLDLPYEKVDDLQLAVLSVLAATDVEAVTIGVEVADDRVIASVGPLPVGSAGDRGLRRVLERLVDSVEPSDGGGSAASSADGEWISLHLTRPASSPSAA